MKANKGFPRTSSRGAWRRHRIGWVGACLVIVALLPTNAMAGNVDPAHQPSRLVNGAPPGVKTWSVSSVDRALTNEKQRLVTEFERARAGTLDWATFDQHRLAFEAKVGGAPRAHVGATTAARPFYCIPSCDPSASDADIFTVYQAQANSYYCGPVSAWMILNAMGYPNSVRDGAALTQANLATPTYLETTPDTGTPWWVSSLDQPYPQTLNAWRTGSYSGYYQLLGSPSASTQKSDMVFDIVYGYPVAMNTTEYYTSQYHLPGHPTDYTYYATYGPIGHWLDNGGFHNYGWTVHYADSATSVWSGVPQFSDVNLTDINTLLQDRGIVW